MNVRVAFGLPGSKILFPVLPLVVVHSTVSIAHTLYVTTATDSAVCASSCSVSYSDGSLSSNCGRYKPTCARAVTTSGFTLSGPTRYNSPDATYKPRGLGGAIVGAAVTRLDA